MKEILVAVADYPDVEGNKSLLYVHTRNLFYKKNNIIVDVLNFKAKKSYIIDDIHVITLDEYIKNKKVYNILILHAPNIRNHFFFLNKYGQYFKKFIFFFHGHEIIKLNKMYPPKYSYMKDSFIRNKFQDVYDSFKLMIWKKYLPKIACKSFYIFVSKNLLYEFLELTNLDIKLLKDNVYIINNGVGEYFKSHSYNVNCEKKYDFISIRSNLDSSVYCVDLLCKLALLNPELKFLLIGRGRWFKYNEKPKNVIWIDRYLNHSEMMQYIDESRVALMLTRRDSQGVMSCELATYGIPVVTSDLKVCHEMFDDVVNVIYLNNDNLEDVDLKKLEFINQYEKCKKYYSCNTEEKELTLIKRAIGEKK